MSIAKLSGATIAWSKGRLLTRFTKDSTTSHMTYDANGIRMSKLRVNHIDIVDSSYIYDSNGRLRTETEGAYTRRYLYSSDGEIISRKTIESCIDAPDRETYRIVVDGRNVGGVILKINNETHHNELEILFVSPEEHTKGIGYGAWQAVEKLHPETEVWETCTPYFEKRNIHFYVNKCGFQIERYRMCDWGDTCYEDWKMNDEAVKHGDDRIVAKYCLSFGNIFIITEWDRSATTVMFCGEY